MWYNHTQSIAKPLETLAWLGDVYGEEAINQQAMIKDACSLR